MNLLKYTDIVHILVDIKQEFCWTRAKIQIFCFCSSAELLTIPPIHNHMDQKQQRVESSLDEIKSTVEKEFVYHFQEMLINALQTNEDLKFVMDWSSLSKLKGMTNYAAELVQNHAFWVYLYRGVSRFVSNADQRELFVEYVHQIDFVFVDDVSSHLIHRGSSLIYKINPLNLPLLPNDIYNQISDEFSEYWANPDDVKVEKDTDYSMELSKFDQNKPIEILKSISKEDHAKPLLDSLLRSNKKLWVANKLQQEHLDVCKRLLLNQEPIVRVWSIMKVNVQFMYQERVFVLTDSNFYTFKVEKGDVNLKHTKSYKLDEVVVLDIGRYVDKAGKQQKTKEGGYGLAIYTSEELGSDDIHATKKSKKGAIRVQTGETKQSVRPSTENLRVHYFASPASIYQSEDQFTFLQEVAWCIYIAAHDLKKDTDENIFTPYEDIEIEKPKSGVGSFFYNKLGLGKK